MGGNLSRNFEQHQCSLVHVQLTVLAATEERAVADFSIFVTKELNTYTHTKLLRKVFMPHLFSQKWHLVPRKTHQVSVLKLVFVTTPINLCQKESDLCFLEKLVCLSLKRTCPLIDEQSFTKKENV